MKNQPITAARLASAAAFDAYIAAAADAAAAADDAYDAARAAYNAAGAVRLEEDEMIEMGAYRQLEGK